MTIAHILILFVFIAFGSLGLVMLQDTFNTVSRYLLKDATIKQRQKTPRKPAMAPDIFLAK